MNEQEKKLVCEVTIDNYEDVKKTIEEANKLIKELNDCFWKLGRLRANNVFRARE